MLPRLRQRHLLLSAVRGFFSARGFLEVSTPARLPVPALEDYIDAEPAGAAYLRTSPELHMKRLLAAGAAPVFQLGPVFRRGEYGTRHLPEFTMLEWYRTDADYDAVLADAVALVRDCARALAPSVPGPDRALAEAIDGTWEELALETAFARYARRGLDDAVAAGVFEQVLVEDVEPRLGRDRPTVVKDYPLACGGFARRGPRPDRVERWELYMGGLELANGCSEVTDPDEQLARFRHSAALRRTEERPSYPVDEAFMAALRAGLPRCAGVALGVDRLLMALTGAAAITAVVAFPGPPVPT